MEHVMTDQREMNSVRSLRLKAMLKMEIQGLKGRGRSAYSIIKREYDLQGNKQKVFDKFKQLMCPDHHWMLVPRDHEEWGLTYVCGYPDCTVLVYKRTMTRAERIVPGDQRTRTLRNKCHRLFDPMWEGKAYFKTRHFAYKWLASVLKIDVKDCHFGYFTQAQCVAAIKVIGVKRDIEETLLGLL